MIYKKRVSSGPFFKKGVDIKDGDLVEIANEGKQQEGEFGTQNIFLVKLSDEREGNISLNQTSLNNLIDAYGENAVNWIGKQAKIWLIRQNVAGKFLQVLYVSSPDAEFTDDGFVLLGKKDENIPVVEEGEDIDVKDIPF